MPGPLLSLSALAVLAAAATPAALPTLPEWLRNNGVVTTLVAAVLVIFGRKLQRTFLEWRKSCEADKVHLWNLVRRPWSKKKIDEVALIQAINQGAVDAAADRPRLESFGQRVRRRLRELVPFALRPSKATLIWSSMIRRLRFARSDYIAPDYRSETTGSRKSRGHTRVDGVTAVREWLEASTNRVEPNPAGRVWVIAPGTAGKSCFMDRLFLDLLRASSDPAGPESAASRIARVPVPMLASAENLRSQRERIKALKERKEGLNTFVTIWLERRILVPADVRDELVAKLEKGLREGQILLLLDGVDELGRADLQEFAWDLLKKVRYWVASDRPDAGSVEAEHSIKLVVNWDIERIRRRLDRRSPDGSTTELSIGRRETLKRVIADTLAEHAKASARGSVGVGDHWLSHPGHLRDFIESIASEPHIDESEIRRRAESQPRLFRQMFNQALDRVGARSPAVRQRLRQRLFDMAMTDPTKARAPNDSLDEEVLELTELVTTNGTRPAFRHQAGRDFFWAGRVAQAIVDPATSPAELQDLSPPGSLWPKSRLDAVRCWSEDLTTNPVEHIRSRLRPTTDGTPSPIDPTLRRNLLELLLALDREAPLEWLDLSALPGSGLDLQGTRLFDCTFRHAVLHDAELTKAVFTRCDFTGADLANADAMEARFEDCGFGEPGNEAHVDGMALKQATFVAADGSGHQRDALFARGARQERSRYRDHFGEMWDEFQNAALGPGLRRLEEGAYLPAIHRAIAACPGQPAPVYLVDLMAGGSYRRVTDLIDEVGFETLNILGIDRDPRTHEERPRLRWRDIEIGAGGHLNLDLPACLRGAFGDAVQRADIIVGKKAIHEIPRKLQRELIRHCAESLRPGGRLLLFVDAPGPVESADLDREMLPRVQHALEGLRDHLELADCGPEDARHAIQDLRYDGSPTSQLGFANAWTMLKDWANQNRHEVEHRYFASIAEIQEWASEWFDLLPVKLNEYRLNPLMFNELGIKHVRDHLAEQAKLGVKPAEVIGRDLKQLREWVADNERLDVLVEFAHRHLADGSPLARSVTAEEGSSRWGALDPVLAPLDVGTRAWVFGFRCGVLVLEKRALDEARA